MYWQVEAVPELALALADHLAVPLRERNALLLAAGYAPRFGETLVDADAMGSGALCPRDADRRPRPLPRPWWWTATGTW